MQTFIYIATTQGPVRVQAITEEDPGIKSVVCLDGLAEPLAISDRYHDFVKKGTGLIHREFGHGSYRVDVDKPIDQGDSWQLGIYCAHVLLKNDLLCNEVPKKGDQILFITGRVKSNGDITPVERVSEKFEIATSKMQEWSKQGCNVSCLLSTAQMGVPSFSEELAIVHRVNNVSEVIKYLGETDYETGVAVEVIETKASITRKGLMWALIMSLIAIGGGQWYSNNVLNIGASKSTDLAYVDNRVSLLSELSLVVDVANENGDCQNVYKKDIPFEKENQFQPVSFQRLCAITYRLGEGERKFQGLLAFSLDRLGVIQLTQNRSGWLVPIPLAQKNDRTYVVVAIGEGDLPEFSEMLNKQLLRWNLENRRVLFSEVNKWLTQQSIKAEVYKHVLKK